MIEAFELGVALTLETDAARTALNGVGQQLSTLDRDMAAFEKRMTEMPEALARLSVPQLPSSSERPTGQGEHVGSSSSTASLAPYDQRKLQSIANLLDYPAMTHAFGVSPQAQDSAHDENARTLFQSDSGSDGNRITPAATDMLGAMSPSMSDMMLQATELAREAASRVDTVSFPQETAGSTDSLAKSGALESEFAVHVDPRGEFQSPALGAVAEHGDSPSSARIGRDEPASASLPDLLGAFFNQDFPRVAAQRSGMDFATSTANPVFDAISEDRQIGRQLDTASWSVPLASPSTLTSADMAGSFGIRPDLRMNSSLILPGEMQADPATIGVIGSTASWGDSAVPPTFPYPTVAQDNVREAQASSENQRRSGAQSEDPSDGENMSNPLVIHTNVHIDGEVVARVVSEKMVAWMNGPLAGTGGFDGRRSYTPVES